MLCSPLLCSALLWWGGVGQALTASSCRINSVSDWEHPGKPTATLLLSLLLLLSLVLILFLVLELLLSACDPFRRLTEWRLRAYG